MEKTAVSIQISVIIPVYNVEDFIDEAIQSVLNQQLKSLEIILIDDGSTDRSAEICRYYVEEHDQVSYYYQENSGVSNARNKGLSLAQGEYVYFLDSDDTIDTAFLSSSYEMISEKDADLVIIGEHYQQRFPNVMALPTCAAMWKRAFLEYHREVRFPEGIQPCEDGLFSHQLLAFTNKISLNPKGIYHYRQHERQNHILSLVDVDKVLVQIPLWFDILRDFYAKHDLMPKKAFHLALFLEHEPFEFRLLKMVLTSSQYEFLYDLLKKFYRQEVQPYLSSKDYNRLSKPFQLFVQSFNQEDFQQAYQHYINRLQSKGKVRLFFTRFILMSEKRRKLRNRIIVKYKL